MLIFLYTRPRNKSSAFQKHTIGVMFLKQGGGVARQGSRQFLGNEKRDKRRPKGPTRSLSGKSLPCTITGSNPRGPFHSDTDTPVQSM